MADEKPLPSGDNTPTWSWQQLVQTLWQMLGALFAVMTPILMMPDAAITWKIIVLAVGAAIFQTGWTYGGSFIQLPSTKKKT